MLLIGDSYSILYVTNVSLSSIYLRALYAAISNTYSSLHIAISSIAIRCVMLIAVDSTLQVAISSGYNRCMLLLAVSIASCMIYQH